MGRFRVVDYAEALETMAGYGDPVCFYCMKYDPPICQKGEGTIEDAHTHYCLKGEWRRWKKCSACALLNNGCIRKTKPHYLGCDEYKDYKESVGE